MFKWLFYILIFATNIRVTPITKIQNFLHLSKIGYFYQKCWQMNDVIIRWEIAYKAIVRPQLEYAAPVLDPYIQDDIQRIEMVQRRAARWVMSDYSPYSSVSDMLGRLGWRTLEQRRADSWLVLFYKIVHGLVAIPLPTYVIPLNGYPRTTHSLAFRQLYARTDYYKYSFFPLAVVQWNNLSAGTATLTNIDSFKVAISQECHFRP